MNPSVIERAYDEYFPVSKCEIEPDNLLLKDELKWKESWIVHAPNFKFIKGQKAIHSPLAKFYVLGDSDSNKQVIKIREESLESRFRRHLEKFYDETKLTSSIDKIVGNINYLKVIALGSEVIPLILKEYITKGGFWHNALVALTEENPTTAEMYGKQKLIREAWRNWAVKHGYL